MGTKDTARIDAHSSPHTPHFDHSGTQSFARAKCWTRDVPTRVCDDTERNHASGVLLPSTASREKRPGEVRARRTVALALTVHAPAAQMERSVENTATIDTYAAAAAPIKPAGSSIDNLDSRASRMSEISHSPS